MLLSGILFLLPCIFLTSGICFFIASFHEHIIFEKNIYPLHIDKFYRPHGLKIKEIREIIKTTDDALVQTKLRKTIFYRKLGFGLLISILFLILTTGFLAKQIPK